MTLVVKMGTVVAMVVVGSLATITAVWAASGSGGRSAGRSQREGMAAVEDQGAQVGGPAGGAWGALSDDPAARGAMEALRLEHARETREWLDR
jgi:hypothetical protein